MTAIELKPLSGGAPSVDGSPAIRTVAARHVG
jgi:hypothetical protein